MRRGFPSRGVLSTQSNICDEDFEKTVNGLTQLTPFAKRLHHRCSNGFKYATAQYPVLASIVTIIVLVIFCLLQRVKFIKK